MKAATKICFSKGFQHLYPKAVKNTHTHEGAHFLVTLEAVELLPALLKTNPLKGIFKGL